MPDVSTLPSDGRKPSSIRPNMHGYVGAICLTYSMFLRQDCEGRKKPRSAMVFDSAIAEMARLRYIVLVEGKKDISSWMPKYLVRTIKRVRKFPIWVPAPRMMELHGEWLCDRLKPTMENGKIIWHHTA
jgi:hypothetical protein